MGNWNFERGGGEIKLILKLISDDARENFETIKFEFIFISQ